MPAKTTGGMKHWVVQHHDNFTVHEGRERPDTEVKDGERGKRMYGPFESKEAAAKYAERMNGQTLRGLAERR